MTSLLWPLGKHWHPRRRRLARLRALYWIAVRRYETELCGRCGGPVRVVFYVPDALWAHTAGFGHDERSPGSEAAGGVLCVPCFDDLASERLPTFLRWTCTLDDTVLRG